MAFGARRIYYNNFASHLLNSFNPNMLYPGLPHEWRIDEWHQMIDMIRGFGFNTFEFWLVPRLFCREGLESEGGRRFAESINGVASYARSVGMDVEMLCGLATSGPNWVTLCPNDNDDWREIRMLWDGWTKRLKGLSIVGIFPGDPGACSRNGCTAETYVDRSIDIAAVINRNIPHAEIEFHTWGPPFFGWGIIELPEGSCGEFLKENQSTAWRFVPSRAERSMTHLCRRLNEFPQRTSVAINMGFNPDGRSDGAPDGSQDARRWVKEIATTNRVLTWDYSLTEGENSVVPHYRFQRLFRQRRLERDVGAYSGGICYTMSPLLNQLSLYEAAQSFLDPDADADSIARAFYTNLFGEDGRLIPELVRHLEVVHDWGSYPEKSVDVSKDRQTYHNSMTTLVDLLQSVRPRDGLVFHPEPDSYRKSLLFFAELFRDLSGPNPDFSELRSRYWNAVYGIYDLLPQHVDPRPRSATNAIIDHFRS